MNLSYQRNNCTRLCWECAHFSANFCSPWLRQFYDRINRFLLDSELLHFPLKCGGDYKMQINTLEALVMTCDARLQLEKCKFLNIFVYLFYGSTQLISCIYLTELGSSKCISSHSNCNCWLEHWHPHLFKIESDPIRCAAVRKHYW